MEEWLQGLMVTGVRFRPEVEDIRSRQQEPFFSIFPPPKPKTQNPKPKTQNPKPLPLNPKP